MDTIADLGVLARHDRLIYSTLSIADIHFFSFVESFNRSIASTFCFLPLLFLPSVSSLSSLWSHQQSFFGFVSGCAVASKIFFLPSDFFSFFEPCLPTYPSFQLSLRAVPLPTSQKSMQSRPRTLKRSNKRVLLAGLLSRTLLLSSTSLAPVTRISSGRASGTITPCFFLTRYVCLLYTSPSPRDATLARMPSSA